MSFIREKLGECRALIWVILVLLLMASGGGTYFFSFIYQPNIRAIGKLEHHLAFIRQERQIWEEERQAKGVTEVEQTDFTARFNYLTKHEIGENQLIPMLLSSFQVWFNREDLSFQNLTSLGSETVNSCLIERIALSGRADFSRFCRLLEWLEKDMLAVVDGFDLPPDCFPAAWDRGGSSKRDNGCGLRPFNIIFHWVENVPRRFRSSPEFPQPVMVKRNPFIPSRLEKIYDGRHPLPKDKIVYLPPPANIRLQGIITGENGPQAMISNKFYKAGAGMSGGYLVLSITDEEVIIGRDNIRHRLKLPRKIFNRE